MDCCIMLNPQHLTAAALPFMMKLRKVTSRFP